MVLSTYDYETHCNKIFSVNLLSAEINENIFSIDERIIKFFRDQENLISNKP